MLALMPLIQLSVEASHVIGLRLVRIATGHPDALAEIQLMMSEKIDASVEAVVSLTAGGSADQVIARYREHVANNQRRLSE